jgi:two-component sensor histidine kinase
MKYVQDVFLLKRNGWILAGILSLTLMLSLFWNWQQMEQQVHELALNSLKLSFEKDVVYRRWAANHGGVYVPVSEHTQPNPYLNHIPERDIVTSTGVSMTLVNPAYMTRQVYELSRKQYGLQGHITSLNPLRPENIPDEWEEQSLKKFDEGAKEAIIVMDIDGLPYMRLMMPFFTEEGCLKCHGHQGYKTGDIHGGISVSTPISSYLAHIQSRQYALLAGHGIIWIAGLFFIGYTTSRIVAARMAGEEERKQAEKIIKASLKEKETLLKEVHHRVKNNMQVISSLLNFHVLKEKDEHVIKALMDCRGRISSMACVHEMLYMSESLSVINCHDYISKLAYDILQSYYPGLHRVKITVDAKGVILGIQQATPLGLIINEMLSNALKYGFPENRHGQIMIRLKMCEPNIIEFIFSDNGIGIPKDLDWRNTESLGLNLIVLLAENQLGGTVTLDRKQGTCFVINFSLENNQT